MPNVTRMQGDLQVTGSIMAGDGFVGITRDDLRQDSLAEVPILPHEWRQWNDIAVTLPATPASDDLGLVTGTPGTHWPTLQTGDLKNTTTTRKAAFLERLGPEHVAGGNIRLRLNAQMVTTIASTSTHIDVEVYADDGDGTPGSDLCQTAQQSMNSLSAADFDFIINGAGLAPGAGIYVVVSISVVDSATPTAVTGKINAVTLLHDVQG